MVSGPIAATVTGSGDVVSRSARATTAGRGSTRAGDGGSCHAPEPGVPVHVPGALRLGVHQRVAGAGGHRDVGPPRQVQHAQRVLRRLRQLDVAVDGGDQAQVDLGAGQRQQDGQGVVDAGIGVDDQGRGGGHPTILDEAPVGRHAGCVGGSPGMTGPPTDRFSRSEPRLVDLCTA